MTFVNEEISGEDKAKYDWSKFKAWDFSRPLRPWKWTIDREKDVFFVGLEGQGPDGERPETYALYWKGNVIRIEAYCTGEGKISAGVDLFWEIQKIYLPPEIQIYHEEIINDLKNAIDMYGAIYDRDVVKSVKVNFLLGE
jgi:hypothetical protein